MPTLAQIAGANGVYCGLAPEPAAAAYGVDKPDFTMLQIIKSMGYTFVSSAILAILVLNGMGVGKAIAWSAVPWLLQSLDNIWNGTAKKMGQPEQAPLLLLAINCAVMYCGFTDTNTDLAAKCFAAWCGANGVYLALQPEKGAEAWGVKTDAKLAAMMKNFGYALAAYAALVYFLNDGAATTTAIGYSWAIMLASIADGLFVSKTFENVSSDKQPAYIWGAIQAFVVAATLVE